MENFDDEYDDEMDRRARDGAILDKAMAVAACFLAVVGIIWIGANIYLGSGAPDDFFGGPN